MKKGLKYFLILIAGINIIGVMYYFTLSPEELKQLDKEQKEKIAMDSINESKEQLEANTNADRSIEAFVYAQEQIEKQIKSPNSAEWPTASESLLHQKGKIYTFKSYFDSQNSFGAMIRTKYICVVEENNNLYTIKKLQIFN
jgi:hypothetical protein